MGYTIRVWVPVGARIPFFAIISIPAILASYSVDIGHSCLRRKTAQAWNCPLTSIAVKLMNAHKFASSTHTRSWRTPVRMGTIPSCTRDLEKLTVAQMVKQPPLFVKTLRFNTVLITGRHCSPSSAFYLYFYRTCFNTIPSTPRSLKRYRLFRFCSWSLTCTSYHFPKCHMSCPP